VTLNELRAFLMAVRTGSFTAAAEELGVAQASVSELVRRMEHEFDVSLFARGGRRLILTRTGEELLPWAEQAVEAAERGRRTLVSIRALEGGVTTFGLFRNARFYLLDELLAEFHEHYPKVRIRVVGQNSVEIAAAVAAGTLEAGLVVLPIEDTGLTVTPLMRDEVLYASAVTDRLRGPVTIKQLADAPLILYDAHYGWNDPTRRQLADRARLEGCKLTPLIEVEYLDGTLGLVARGVGDTILSRAAFSSGLVPPEINGVPFAEPLYHTIALVHKESAVLSAATAELARMAKQRLRERQRKEPDALDWLGDPALR